MKVWVVLSDDSDKRVLRICKTKERALALASQYNRGKDRYSKWWHIIEHWEVEED